MRRQITAILHGLLFSGIFIGLVAVGSSLITSLVLRFPINSHLLLFIFGGTLLSYNLHWYFSPMAFFSTEGREWSRRHQHKRLFIVIAAALLAVYGLSQLSVLVVCVSIVTAVATLLYTAPKIPALQKPGVVKKLLAAKTTYLTVVWTAVTVVLPITTQAVFTIQAFLFLLHRFFLLFALSLLFDLRDREQDQLEGTTTLATRLPDSAHTALFLILIISSIIPVFFMTIPDVAGVAGITLSLFALLTLYRPARTTRSDVFYYLVLDGLLTLPLLPYIIKAAFH